jgi:hypothetical protein
MGLTTRQSVFCAVTLLAFAVWLAGVLANGWLEARFFDGAPVDGPFQLFDSLRRLDAGQRPGRDFPFFHGVGIPWLHYLPYRILGGNLWASEFTREWLSTLTFLFTSAVFGYVALGTTAGTAIFVALASFAASMLGLRDLYGPAHSMLGVRSSFPVLLFALLLSRASNAWKVAGGSVLLGLALACGTEQGLYTAAACGLTAAMCMVRRPDPSGRGADNWRVLAGILLGGVIAYGAALALLCSPAGVVSALRYAFRDLPADQLWFAGAPPAAFAATLKSLRAVGDWAMLTIAGGFIWWLIEVRRFWVNRGSGSMRLLMLTAGLFACASYSGQLNARYFLTLGRAVVFCALWELISRVGAARKRDGSLETDKRSRGAPWALALTAVVIVPLGLRPVVKQFVEKASSLGEYQKDHLVSGVWLSADWAGHLAAFESATSPIRDPNPCGSVWASFASLIQSEMGCINPAEDYIIHVLGPVSRVRYFESFNRVRPRYVITMRPSTMLWEEQMRNEYWPFYAELLRGYDVAAVSHFAMIWKRTELISSSQGAETILPVPRAGDALEVPTNVTTGANVVVLRVRYGIENPLHFIPLLGGMPRYLVEIEGALSHTPMSLAPYYKEMSFPVLLQPGQQPRLIFHAASILPGARLSVEEVGVKPIRLREAQLPFLERGPDFWRP